MMKSTQRDEHNKSRLEDVTTQRIESDSQVVPHTLIRRQIIPRPPSKSQRQPGMAPLSQSTGHGSIPLSLRSQGMARQPRVQSSYRIKDGKLLIGQKNQSALQSRARMR